VRSLEVRLHDVDLALLGGDDLARERLELVVSALSSAISAMRIAPVWWPIITRANA
jgi:hypothetical protein